MTSVTQVAVSSLTVFLESGGSDRMTKAKSKVTEASFFLFKKLSPGLWELG